MASLTSANAIITLTVPGLFNVPLQLQGFSAENIYEADDLATVQTAMGVDGKLSGGYIFVEVKQTFTMQADSASNALFEQWAATQRQIKDVLTANGETTLSSVNRSYIMTKGFLSTISQMPNAGKILQPRRYAITWESVQAVPV